MQKVILTPLDREAIAAADLGWTVAYYRMRKASLASEDRELPGGVAPTPIEVAVQRFLSTQFDRRTVRSEATARTYRADLLYFQRFVQGDRNRTHLHEVTSEDIQNWLDKAPRRRRSQGLTDESGARKLSPETIRKKLAFLRQFFRFAEESGLVTNNPTRNVAVPPQRKPFPKHLTQQEYRRLLRGVPRGRHHERDVLMLRIMGEAGLRINALVHLKVEDVILNPDDGRVRRFLLTRNKGGVPGEAVIFRPLVPALERYLSRKNLSGHPGHFLFSHPRDPKRPLSTHQVWVIFHEASRRAGIEDRLRNPHPHSLRHSFGHEMKRRGVPLDDIQVLMNHASISSTAIYSMSSLEEIAREIELKHPLGRKNHG